MTNKELSEQLEKFEPNANVFIEHSNGGVY